MNRKIVEELFIIGVALFLYGILAIAVYGFAVDWFQFCIIFSVGMLFWFVVWHITEWIDKKFPKEAEK